ncbi:MAG: methionine--tRNA ligase [Elusimicrobiota bacterium]|nr:methionine--tRNA ligase [Elusimicrobiota bacterium]
MDKFYITTPIYYVNDIPHIGHTYTTVAADALSRWNRMLGKNVFFLTGTDEHGAKILEKANESNKQPKEFCDEIVEKFKSTWKEMNISYDYFIRTTDVAHESAVKKFLQEIYIKGEIYKSKYDGLYCIQCEKFLTLTEMTPDGLCPEHQVKLVRHQEENYFFRLSDYREKLIEIISNPNHPQHIEIFPVERKNEILGKLKLELPDISISRAGLKWAIPLPFDNTQTTYVWIDALINYISAIGYNSTSNSQLCGTQPKLRLDTSAGRYDFDYWWPADVHLIGKDILWFHTVIWTAMLLSVGLPLPKRIFAHGYFTVNSQKMSKTLGNVILPEELIKSFGVDAARFLLLSAFPFGSDGDININDFKEKYNAHLANNLGNLILRVINMVGKYFDFKIVAPQQVKILDPVKSYGRYIREYIENMKNIAVDQAINSILRIATFGNQYVDREAPWNLARGDVEKLKEVLYNVLVVIKVIAVLSFPFMPQTAEKIFKILDEKETIKDAALKLLPGGKQVEILQLTGKVVSPQPVLFPKIV